MIGASPGYLNRFFQCRHEHFCYYTDMDMQEWAYYVFDYYLECINEVIICSDLFPTDQKIAMIDLHHWVEHYRSKFICRKTLNLGKVFGKEIIVWLVQ